ncbi:DUF1707 domain-containing protein [Nonomuraea sp. NPDC050310]|uniref:DUF1707 SHOCT-like domain-containing protein n=1 Tax=unclassified Nonomuraea TaxID=2593643 RepID=UPI003408DF86
MSDDLRASDEDRDRVAAVLGEALATGRLTSPEHLDRLEAAYAAKTVGELVPITRDLPDVDAKQAPLALGSGRVDAVLGKTIRKGRWTAARELRLHGRFGALVIDLSEAVLPGREITLHLDVRFTKLIVRVPDECVIIDEGTTILGKRNVSGGSGSGGPVIRVTGRAILSKVVIDRGITDWNLAQGG